MTEAETTSRTLPPILIDAIERQTGGRVAQVVPRAGGGASRAGAEVVVAFHEGTSMRGYLGYDTRLGDAMRPGAFAREAAILGALSGPLADREVSAPRLLATEPSMFALFTAFAPGTDKWKTIEPETDRIDAARDMVRQIAALHVIDTAGLTLDGFGDPSEPTSVRVRQKLQELREMNLRSSPDAILLCALDWLEENVPADDGPSVIVHGDAGPANFLAEGPRCTALLDWELAHYGDPMEDIAGIWVRMLFNDFIPMRDVIATYEAASGRRVNIERVKYYRLFFQLSFTVPSRVIENDPKSPPAMIGTRMLFSTAHLRIITQQTAELYSLPLEPYMPAEVEPTSADRAFEVALDDIREVIVPRASDQLVAVKAKSLARMVKFWRRRERYGASYDAAEIAEINAALGVKAATVAEARRALGLAVAKKRIDQATALNLCNRRMVRETELMGDAMGWFRTTYFAPLD